MVKFTYLCKDKTQREHMVFSVENKFTDKLISALWDEFSTEFEIFVSSTLEKYKQFWAALKAGIRKTEPESRNRNPESGIRNPETGNQKKLQDSAI